MEEEKEEERKEKISMGERRNKADGTSLRFKLANLQMRLTGHKTAVPHPHHSPQTARDTRHLATVNILYSAKFSGVFNFANFANFQLFVKIFQRKFLTCGMRRAVCTCSEFTKLFQQNLQKLLSAKI